VPTQGHCGALRPRIHHHQSNNLWFQLIKWLGSGTGAIDANLDPSLVLGILETRKLGNMLFITEMQWRHPTSSGP
jgi:hypothetical protein